MLCGRDMRSEWRAKGIKHAFITDSADTICFKCYIRNVSLSGCKIVSSRINDLPDLVKLIPEGFNKPINAIIVWKRGKYAGLCFEHTTNDRLKERFKVLRAEAERLAEKQKVVTDSKKRNEPARCRGFQERLTLQEP